MTFAVSYQNTMHYISFVWYVPWFCKWLSQISDLSAFFSRYPCSLNNFTVFFSLTASLHS